MGSDVEIGGKMSRCKICNRKIYKGQWRASTLLTNGLGGLKDYVHLVCRVKELKEHTDYLTSKYSKEIQEQHDQMFLEEV